MAKGDGTLRGLLADLNRVAVAAALVDARDTAIDAEAAGDITADQAELLRETGQSFGGKARGPRPPRSRRQGLRHEERRRCGAQTRREGHLGRRRLAVASTPVTLLSSSGPPADAPAARPYPHLARTLRRRHSRCAAGRPAPVTRHASCPAVDARRLSRSVFLPWQGGHNAWQPASEEGSCPGSLSSGMM